MLNLTNPWVLVGVLSLVISSYFYGHHEAYVEQEAEVARLNLIERDKEQQMQQLENQTYQRVHWKLRNPNQLSVLALSSNQNHRRVLLPWQV